MLELRAYFNLARGLTKLSAQLVGTSSTTHQPLLYQRGYL